MTAIICAIALTMTPAAAHCQRGGEAVDPGHRGGPAILALAPIGNLAAWTCIHNGTPVAGGEPGTDGQGEGAWNADGYYHGGLQMDRAFEEAWGPDMLHKYGGQDAGAWSPRDQMVVAQRAYLHRGYEPWPQTSRACGLSWAVPASDA